MYDAAQTGELLGFDRCTVIRWVQLERLHGPQRTFSVPWRIRVTAAGGDYTIPDCLGLQTRASPIAPTEAEAEFDEVDPDFDLQDA